MNSADVQAIRAEMQALRRDLRATRAEMQALGDAIADFIPEEGQARFRTRLEQFERLHHELDHSVEEEASPLHCREPETRVEIRQERVAG